MAAYLSFPSCSVFELTNNDRGCAPDNIALAMNAPSFVSSMPPPSSAFREVPSLITQCFSQEMLDEQYARKLAIEAQTATAQLWPLQSMQSHTTYSQSYQPRRRGHPPAQPEDQYVNTTVVGSEAGSNYIEFAECTLIHIIPCLRSLAFYTLLSRISSVELSPF